MKLTLDRALDGGDSKTVDIGDIRAGRDRLGIGGIGDVRDSGTGGWGLAAAGWVPATWATPVPARLGSLLDVGGRCAAAGLLAAADGALGSEIGKRGERKLVVGRWAAGDEHARKSEHRGWVKRLHDCQ